MTRDIRIYNNNNNNNNNNVSESGSVLSSPTRKQLAAYERLKQPKSTNCVLIGLVEHRI